MRHVRFLLAAAAAIALVAAGCGGSKPTATNDTAAPAPADSTVYATLDTDRDSAQWQQLEKLLERVPGAKQAVDGLLSDALDEAGLDWDEDVAPALGPQVVVVLVGASDPVALTQPDDGGKLRALLSKGDKKLVTRELDGWTAVAETERALDAYERALKRGRFRESALAHLPDDALAKVYVDGKGLSALGNVVGTAPPLPVFDLGTFALAVVAEDEGLRLTGTANQRGLPSAFTPKLLDQVPSGALLAATFKGGKELTAQLRQAFAGAGAMLEGLEKELGVSFEGLVSLFEGEGVVYVRAGIPIPEVTLVLQQTSAGQAATLGQLFASLARLSKGNVSTATEDGVKVTRLALGPVSVAYGAADGLLFVTTGRGAIAAFRGADAKLVDERSFERAADRVGYTGSTSAFVYADVDGLVPLLQGLAGLAGGSTSDLDDATKALGALDSLALNVIAQGDEAKLEGFLAVR